MINDIETINDHGVGATGHGLVTILNPPLFPMGRDEALRMAAWIVAVADPTGNRFKQIYDAVCNT